MSSSEVQTLEPTLAALVAELGRQTAEARDLTDELSEEQFRWRPAEHRWSIGENLAHLALTNRRYLEPMDRLATEARERGQLAPGPYRNPWIGRLLIRSMEPPVRRFLRVRTFPMLAPDSDRPKAEVLQDFLSAQEELRRVIERANGVDLGGVRMRSPFMKQLKLTLGQALQTVAAHNRRHLWQARQVREASRFPDA